MADRKPDELDNMLHAALAKYAAVEPRAGLEDRVLANLLCERSRVSNRAWWRWSVAGALAAVIVVAVALAWRSNKPSHPVASNYPSIAAEAPKEPVARVLSNGVRYQVRTRERGPIRNAAIRRARPKVVVTDNPKLDQFPSPQPPSEQEKILESYVAKYPEHAALIARARAEELRRDAAEEMRYGETGSEKGSQQ